MSALEDLIMKTISENLGGLITEALCDDSAATEFVEALIDNFSMRNIADMIYSHTTSANDEELLGHFMEKTDIGFENAAGKLEWDLETIFKENIEEMITSDTAESALDEVMKTIQPNEILETIGREKVALWLMGSNDEDVA